MRRCALTALVAASLACNRSGATPERDTAAAAPADRPRSAVVSADPAAVPADTGAASARDRRPVESAGAAGSAGRPTVSGSPPSGRAQSSVPGDSVRGTVAVTGAAPLTWVVLRPADGAPQLTLTGESARTLRRLAGLEITARGSPAGAGQFEVREFVVRSAEGRPAVDGRLVQDGGRYALVLADGSRRSVANLPVALRDKVGARVYLVGPLDGDVEGFGLIDEPR